MAELKPTDALERMGSSLFSLRLWLSKSWRIAVLMTKGSYLLAERRRLLLRLGEELFQQRSRGELKPEAFEDTIQRLDRLTKKIAVEEVLINRIRYGKKTPHQAAQAEKGEA
jgi:hypothetical protein